jgi:hypothetical protein
LPWEDQDEYCGLLDALVAEHKPERPTEEHLIEEMAGVLWRKRRLRLAEASALRQGLESAISSDDTVKAALAHLNIGKKATAAITDFDDLDQREAPTVRALDLLSCRQGAGLRQGTWHLERRDTTAMGGTDQTETRVWPLAFRFWQ